MLLSKKHICALALALLPSFALSDDSQFVKLCVGEEILPFEIWKDQSDWSGSLNFGSASIFSLPETRERFRELAIGFQIKNGLPDNEEIRFRRVEKGNEAFLCADKGRNEGDATVTISKIVEQSGELLVEGQFSAALGTSSNYCRSVDFTDALSISGQFSVALNKL